MHHSFPFVVFSIEQKRQALCSARLQMTRRHFERDADAISTLTVDDLTEAAKEEQATGRITNMRVNSLCRHVFASCGQVKGSDSMRALYQGQIWGTCL